MVNNLDRPPFVSSFRRFFSLNPQGKKLDAGLKTAGMTRGERGHLDLWRFTERSSNSVFMDMESQD